MNKVIHQSKVKKGASRSGFTLLEIIVAAGILGFMLSVMLAFFLNALMLNETSRNLTIAVSHAQHVMEDIRNATFENVPEQINAGIWTWNTAAVAAHSLKPLKDELITTTKVGTDLLTVTVTVTWSDSSGRPGTFVLMTHMVGA